MARLAIFDLDGTLVDSDDALRHAFIRLGVPESEITRGHVIADECQRLGILLEDYLAAYDAAAVAPFPGATELVGGLGWWAVCSNKHPLLGWPELRRLGWSPEVALFADAFDGGAKRLEPVIAALGVEASEVVFVGDTAHDRSTAETAGVSFVWAGWNPRTVPSGPYPVLSEPGELRELLEAAEPQR